jgi:hypothetical protein
MSQKSNLVARTNNWCADEFSSEMVLPEYLKNVNQTQGIVIHGGGFMPRMKGEVKSSKVLFQSSARIASLMPMTTGEAEHRDNTMWCAKPVLQFSEIRGRRFCVSLLHIKRQEVVKDNQRGDSHLHLKGLLSRERP